MRDSSSEYAAACILTTRPSRALFAWWLSLHLLLLVAVLGVDVGTLASGVLLLGVGAHAIWRLPRGGEELSFDPETGWSIPARGLYGLQAGAATSYTYHWVRLCLERPDAAPVCLLLLKDQVSPAAWRRLQSLLRD